MKHLGVNQIKVADLMPKKLVTCVQYDRQLFVYEPGDQRITERQQHLQAIHRAREAAIGKLPTESQRMQEMLRVSQSEVKTTEGVDYDWLTSAEIALELMDSLTFVHNFVDGKGCC